MARPQASAPQLRFARLLDALLPMRRVDLVRSGPGYARAMPERTELMPALSLGDVIEEELALATPFGALVAIAEARALRDTAGDAARSEMLGRMVAEALIGTAGQGLFPIDRETDALYLLALSYDALAQEPAMAALGLVAAPFRAGLGAVLASYWIGPAVPGSAANRLLSGPRGLCSPQLRAYLADLDGSFTAPDPALADPALVRLEGARRDHAAWLRELEARVSVRLGWMAGAPAREG
ncbi:hypothetical protein [Limimaricola pyoseonensis]|uniref:hypothetical protein n=1 Tax=Limimaricola pyoseonensis TaxID=521013 RepID=UPI000B7DD615|nr:hypothetical protein [Limimaricola pyoseonensis]